MKIEYAVRAWAGLILLLTLALGYLVSPWWHVFTGFVGVMLIQSAFTGFCPAESIFKKLGIGRNDSSCCK